MDRVRCVPAALWVFREIDNVRSAKAKYFRLMIEGDWPDLDEAEREMGITRKGFYTIYDVVADTPEEALEYLKRFEPAAVRDSLCVDSDDVLEDRLGGPAGV